MDSRRKSLDGYSFCKLKTHFIEKILEKACRRQCPAPTSRENSVSNCSVPRQQGKVPPGSCEVHTRNLQNSVWDFLHLPVSLCCAPSMILLSRVEGHLEPRLHSAERFTSGDQCVEINPFLCLVSNLLSCFVFLILTFSKSSCKINDVFVFLPAQFTSSGILQI